MQQKPRSCYRANKSTPLKRPLSAESHQNLIRSKLDKGAPKSKISFNSDHQFVSYSAHKICVTHTHPHTHTSTQTFSKNGEFVFRTPQNVQIYQKTEVENFHESNTFFYRIQKKVKMVNSCSGHPKTCRFIKKRKSKIFTNPILSSIEYRRK